MIRVLKNKIAAIPIFDSDQTKSGLYIPEIARERCKQGVVKYVGPECELVKPGDFIIFSGYTGTLIRFEHDGLLIILPEDFVVAVIDEPTTKLPGLYFKDAHAQGTLHKCPECEAPVISAGVHLNLEPRIIYSPEYFEATYEKALDLIKEYLQNSDWFTELNRKALANSDWPGKSWIVTTEPKPEDYDRT